MTSEQNQIHEKNFVQQLMEWTGETVQQNLAMFRCRLRIKGLEKEIDHLREKIEGSGQNRYH